MNDPALSEDFDKLRLMLLGYLRPPTLARLKATAGDWVVLHHVCSYVLHCSGCLKQTENGQGEMAKLDNPWFGCQEEDIHCDSQHQDGD